MCIRIVKLNSGKINLTNLMALFSASWRHQDWFRGLNGRFFYVWQRRF